MCLIRHFTIKTPVSSIFTNNLRLFLPLVIKPKTKVMGADFSPFSA